MTPPGQLPRRLPPPPPDPSDGAVPFLDDDPGYERWLRDHPTGFVLNCDREPKASYLVLHRASCHTISGSPSRGDNWTTALQKVCAPALAELDRWARNRTGASPGPCGTCRP